METHNWQDEYDQARASLKALLDLMNMNQRDAAKEMGMSHGTVTNFLLGRVLPQTETIGRVQEQILKWEKKFGRAKLETMARERGTIYVPTVALLRANVECPQCHEMTPGPSEGKGGPQPLYCCWCGHSMGVACPECGVIETRVSKKYCGECGSRLRPEG